VRRIARWIFNRWVLIAIGLVVVAVLIWWVGPTISIRNVYPFEAEWVRWLQIAILFLTPVVRVSWRLISARRANAALASALVKPEVRVDPAAGEVAQLRQRFDSAVGLLRKRSFGTERPSLWARLRLLGSQQYLYDLPWYVFIGAPGAGKTTALVNSGLRFPLADRLGRDAVRGVGGTRDCDWWFTDEAVFLDTAGRYTTQQSNQDVDAGAWKGFLHLLKRFRPRRPINGVLVTVSVGDLLQQSPAEREAQSVALRARVRELYEDLGVRVPIYVLVTKSDLLAGFSEFFATLGREDRAQVWGFSLPFGDQAFDRAMLSTQLEALERRLYDRLPERLEEEREPARRALLYGFPQQFALLRDRLVDFVEATFAPTRFEAVALVRGVYFTSGTQEGSPIDRAMGALARGLGLERQLLPAQNPSGRSYFLTRLLRDVVFPEAGLAGFNLRGERRIRWVQRAAIGLAAAVLVLMTAAWWVSYRHNRDYLALVGSQFDEIKRQVSAVQGGAKGDLAVLLPTLTRVHTLSETVVNPDGSVPWSYRFGLYQGGKLAAASRAAYRRMLQDTFLPVLTTYLEQSLGRDAAGAQPDTYETLKTYVMLYDPGHFDPQAAWGWYESRAAELLPGADPSEQKALKAHFDMLYQRGWVEPTVARNDAVLAQARSTVARDPLAKRVYQRLKRESAPELRDFTVVDRVGPKAMLVFERVSHEPLTKGVPGFYTKDGYYRQFMKRLDTVAAQLAEEETWVMGTGRSAAAGLVSGPGVAESVRRLYLEDYRNIWRRFINDIALTKDRDLTRIIDVTRTLSGPDSPLKALVKAFDRETTLSVPPEGEPGLAGTVAGKAQEYTTRARQIMTGASGDALAKTMVDDQFEDIHRLAAGPTPPVDGLIQQLNDFYQVMVAAKTALDTAQQPPGPESSTKLRAEAARQPEPVRDMLQGLVERGTGEVARIVRQRQLEELQKASEKKVEEERQTRERKSEEERQAREKKVAEERLAREKKAEEERLAREKKATEIRQTRERIDAELRSQVAEFCVRAIDGRYPFVRSSPRDVTPEDFSRLFAPGGLLDSFFQKQLAPHVDTTRKPWRFREPQMGSSSALVEFQRAQVIRDVFFRGGGTTPSIQLEFKPLEMDASIQKFTLDVDGKLVRYAHGPQVPVRVQFPGPSGRSQVRVSISPPARSGSSGLKFEGPWALFRMFDDVKIEQTSQYERFIATINVEGRRAEFEILASSVRNPFRLPELSQFRCPVAL
jgi:type VI secretion system protein ImpL